MESKYKEGNKVLVVQNCFEYTGEDAKFTKQRKNFIGKIITIDKELVNNTSRPSSAKYSAIYEGKSTGFYWIDDELSFVYDDNSSYTVSEVYNGKQV